MSPEDVKAIRKRLKLTARDLGADLGVGSETILAWERGESFPTKKHVEALRQLDAEGPKPRAKPEAEPWQSLAFWALVRKLVAHPDLRAKVEKLAADYEDPGR